MQRTKFECAEGMGSFTLSKMVADLKKSSFRTFSYEHGGVAWKAKKAVLRVLTDHYPNIWPSVQRIADKAGYSERQTQKALHDIEKDGYIRAISSRKGGSENSVQYELNVNQIRVQAELDQLKKQFLDELDAACDEIKRRYPREEWNDEATSWIIKWNLDHEYLTWEWSHSLADIPLHITGWYSDWSRSFMSGKA